MSANPFTIQRPLFGNPLSEPIFKATVKGADGSIAVADPKATRALVAIMDMHAVIGGAASHFGGPAAFAELMSAVHGFMFERGKKNGKPWHELFHFVNDAGHCENGLYALKANYRLAGITFDALKKFRSIESPLSGHGEAHLFPEGVLLSNGPLGSAFPQSQGLAMAEALSTSQRVTIAAISDGACMEGEAREAMASIPGLAKKGLLGPYVLIVSDNNTKLSGRIDQESFSMAPSFNALTELGWKVVELPQGNDLQNCFDAISQAAKEAEANPKIPVVVHARTVKGFGTKKTAESSSGAHGFPLKSASEMGSFIEELFSGQAVPTQFIGWIEELKLREAKETVKGSSIPEEKIQGGISAAMVKARKDGLPVISVTSDLPGSTGVAGFRKEFPQFSFDVGVAESNMISVAAGLSTQGFIPVVDTFAQFGVTKGALPLTMASLSHAPMICIFSHTGFQDAADGASHQALNWVAMTSGIPGVRVLALSCRDEAESLMAQVLQEFSDCRKSGKVPPTTILFLGRENFPRNYNSSIKYSLGLSQILSDTTQGQKKSICLVAVGSMVPQALKAQSILKERGIGCVVINPSVLNSIDWSIVNQGIDLGQGQILVIEDHQWVGGYGNYLAAQLLDNTTGKGLKERLKSFRILAVHGEFGRSAYTSNQLYEKHGIAASSVVREVVELLN